MSYQIQYPIVNRLEGKRTATKRLPTIFAVIGICAIILTISIYVVGAEAVSEYIIPGNNEVTISAFDQMQDNLRNGMPVNDAITAFCTEIIESADLQ